MTSEAHACSATTWGSPSAPKAAFLIHGLASSSQTWVDVAPELVKEGYKSLLLFFLIVYLTTTRLLRGRPGSSRPWNGSEERHLQDRRLCCQHTATGRRSEYRSAHRTFAWWSGVSWSLSPSEEQAGESRTC